MGKAGHRSIIAPLAATFAATVAVGALLALARIERGRRSAPAEREDQRLGLRRGERADAGLRRMALAQIDYASEQIEMVTSDGDDRPVHEARKALKRLRALLRLLEDQLGEEAFERENGIVRDVARTLAGAREADVMLGTLDSLIERHPRKLGDRRGVRRLRERILAERDSARSELGDAHAARARGLAELDALRLRLDRLAPGSGDEASTAGLRRVYKRGRERYRRVRRGKGDPVLAMHEWRKTVKELRYACEALAPRDTATVRAGKEWRYVAASRATGKKARRAAKAQEKSRRRAMKAAARLRRVGAASDELGEILGEEHDLAMFAAMVRGAGTETGRIPGGAQRALLRRVSRRRRRLRERAIGRGKRLYGQAAKELVRDARRASQPG